MREAVIEVPIFALGAAILSLAGAMVGLHLEKRDGSAKSHRLPLLHLGDGRRNSGHCLRLGLTRTVVLELPFTLRLPATGR